jgi:hypothetical protein
LPELVASIYRNRHNQDQLAEYKVNITVNATKAHAWLSTSERENYAKERFPDDTDTDNLNRKNEIKKLMNTGTAVHEHSSAQDNLKVIGIMFDHTPSYGAANSVNILAQGDYLVAEDNNKQRYLIPLTDGVGNVEFGIGERASRVGDVQHEIGSFEKLFDSFRISKSQKAPTAGDIRVIIS